MPVPDYVRRDGVYNLGSHFPANTIGPDLGEFFFLHMKYTVELRIYRAQDVQLVSIESRTWK